MCPSKVVVKLTDIYLVRWTMLLVLDDGGNAQRGYGWVYWDCHGYRCLCRTRKSCFTAQLFSEAAHHPLWIRMLVNRAGSSFFACFSRSKIMTTPSLRQLDNLLRRFSWTRSERRAPLCSWCVLAFGIITRTDVHGMAVRSSLLGPCSCAGTYSLPASYTNTSNKPYTSIFIRF